jgi:hypothetical protein
MTRYLLLAVILILSLTAVQDVNTLFTCIHGSYQRYCEARDEYHAMQRRSEEQSADERRHQADLKP